MTLSARTQIIFNPRWPKDWKERLARQNDPGFQERREAWYREQDPEMKEQKLRAAWDYWKKRRLELGFKDKEE